MRQQPRAAHHQDVPGLTSVYSNSSSSGPSANGTPKRWRSNHKDRHHLALEMSRSSDESIFRGAEILRSEIVANSFDDHFAPDAPGVHLDRRGSHSAIESHHRHNHNHNHDNIDQEVQDIGELPQDEEFPLFQDDEGSSSSSDWSDPWPPPRQVKSSTAENAPVSSGSLIDDQQTNFSFPHAQKWAKLDNEEEDAAEETRIVSDDEDTTVVLARASAILERASELTGVPAKLGSEQHSYTHRPGVPNSIQTSPLLLPEFDQLEDSTTRSSLLHLQPVAQAPYVSRSLMANEPSGHDISALDYFDGEPTQHADHSEFGQEQWHQDPMDLLKDLQVEEQVLLPTKARQQEMHNKDDSIRYAMKEDSNVALMAFPTVNAPSPHDFVVPPSSPSYLQLQQDPGFCHAQRAGTLWQSLVSQHVRFPSKWWNGARSPPMGVGRRQFWNHLGRHRVRGNMVLQEKVRNRGSAGRLLLHLVVRDIMTGEPIVDIAVGCFHPNARGVRRSAHFDPKLEECRDIWLAVRPRSTEISVIENLLRKQQPVDESPLGEKHHVQNTNLKAVFGEKPPIHTLFVLESEVYELFSHLDESQMPPSAVLLERYVPEWQ